jgi:hypothetical protein
MRKINHKENTMFKYILYALLVAAGSSVVFLTLKDYPNDAE